MNYTRILAYLLPGVEWSCMGTYDTIVVFTPNTPIPTQEQCDTAWATIQNNDLINSYSSAIQQLIDSTAMSKNYANGYAVASYVTSSNVQWSAQAIAFVSWRDLCWEYAYQVQAAAQQDPSSLPTLDQFIIGAPVISW